LQPKYWQPRQTRTFGSRTLVDRKQPALGFRCCFWWR